MDIEHLRQQVQGIFARDHPTDIVLRNNPHHMHRNRIGRRAELVRGIILDGNHPVGRTHGRERIVVGCRIDGNRFRLAVAKTFPNRRRTRRAKRGELLKRGHKEFIFALGAEILY